GNRHHPGVHRDRGTLDGAAARRGLVAPAQGLGKKRTRLRSPRPARRAYRFSLRLTLRLGRMAGMTTLPTSAESYTQLHRAGWNAREVAAAGADGPTGVVSGTNGENQSAATGRTQDEAWHFAVAMAEAVGMAGGRR